MDIYFKNLYLNTLYSKLLCLLLDNVNASSNEKSISLKFCIEAANLEGNSVLRSLL